MNLEQRAYNLREEAMKKIRINSFLQCLMNYGILSRFVKGATYSTPNYTIGIGTAVERLPNHWTVTIPDDVVDTVALLCEKRDGTLVKFIFPVHFYEEICDKLVYDEYGQLKFNVSYDGRGYVLKLQGYAPVDIDRFIGNYQAILQG